MRKTLSVLCAATSLLFAANVFAQTTIVNPPPGSGGKPVICSPVGSSTVCN